MVGIVVTDLLKGVLIGLGLAMAKLLWSLSHLSMVLEDDPDHRRAVLHLKGSATFLRLPDLAEILESVSVDRELHVRFEELDYLDHATLEHLMSWERQHLARGGRVVIEWEALDARYRARPPSSDRGSELTGAAESAVPT